MMVLNRRPRTANDRITAFVNANLSHIIWFTTLLFTIGLAWGGTTTKIEAQRVVQEALKADIYRELSDIHQQLNSINDFLRSR